MSFIRPWKCGFAAVNGCFPLSRYTLVISPTNKCSASASLLGKCSDESDANLWKGFQAVLTVLIFLISSPSKAQPTLCPGFGFRPILSVGFGFFLWRGQISLGAVCEFTPVAAVEPFWFCRFMFQGRPQKPVRISSYLLLGSRLTNKNKNLKLPTCKWTHFMDINWI